MLSLFATAIAFTNSTCAPPLGAPSELAPLSYEQFVANISLAWTFERRATVDAPDYERCPSWCSQWTCDYGASYCTSCDFCAMTTPKEPPAAPPPSAPPKPPPTTLLEAIRRASCIGGNSPNATLVADLVAVLDLIAVFGTAGASETRDRPDAGSLATGAPAYLLSAALPSLFKCICSENFDAANPV